MLHDCRALLNFILVATFNKDAVIGLKSTCAQPVSSKQWHLIPQINNADDLPYPLAYYSTVTWSQILT